MTDRAWFISTAPSSKTPPLVKAISSTTATLTTIKTTSNLLFLHFIAVLLATSVVVPACSGLHLSNGGDVNSGVLAHQTHLEANEAPPTNSTMDYLLRVLHGLDKTLEFFQREFRHVNLDAVIGTRIVHASLNVLLERLARYDLLENVPSYVINRIRKLRDAADDVSEVATPYVIVNEAKYYGRIGPILAKNLFALDYDSRDVSEGALLWPYNRREAMEEEESDGCLSEIFGTKTGVTCDISRGCWEKMTRLGYNRYSLSHEIFYLELAEMTGCRTEMQWQMLFHRQRSLNSLQDTFCANMLAEANLIADNDFPPKVQDLFMEQAALCGILGYRQFFNSEWLVKILSWQDQADGCYRWAGWPQERNEEISDLVVAPVRRVDKREERRVSRDCLCHRTAVAASALSQYVRFVLEVWLDEQLS